MKRIIREGVGIAAGSTRAKGRLSVILDGPAADIYPLQIKALADKKRYTKAGGEARARRKVLELQDRNIQMAREYKEARGRPDQFDRSDSDLMAAIGKRHGLKRSQAIDIIKAAHKK
jgi:hypothetical protein